VKIAKADLVPTQANLLDEYRTFGVLEAACRHQALWLPADIKGISWNLAEALAEQYRSGWPAAPVCGWPPRC
jgi:hypothetical protein